MLTSLNILLKTTAIWTVLEVGWEHNALFQKFFRTPLSCLICVHKSQLISCFNISSIKLLWSFTVQAWKAGGTIVYALLSQNLLRYFDQVHKPFSLCKKSLLSQNFVEHRARQAKFPHLCLFPCRRAKSRAKKGQTAARQREHRYIWILLSPNVAKYQELVLIFDECDGDEDYE